MHKSISKKSRKALERENERADAVSDGPNIRGKIPRREIWAVDCETDPFKQWRIPKPFIWGAYNGTEYHQFNTTQQFLDFITSRDCVAYAHNGGRYDWHFCFDHLVPFSPIMVIAGRVAKFKIGECEFRDSYNIMPMPLRAGGAKFEIEDFSIFESGLRDLPRNRAIIQERLRTDCLYLFRMLETFFSEFGMHLTISSASMHAWSQISGMEKPETSREFYQRLAPYYFGGRVECFTPGVVKRDFKIIDINSAYLYAMNYNHPYGEQVYESPALPNSRGGIQRSFITLEAASTGCFPYRGSDGSLTFPTDGNVRTFYVTGWEYLAALETGSLTEYDIHTVLSLPLTINFESYNNHFYRMKTDAKDNNDAARYEFAKRFLCSLYGKFGSNPEKYSEYTVVEPRFIEAACERDGYGFCTELGSLALLSRPILEERQRYYNVAVSSSVTGFIRAYDWRAMSQCSGVQYIDTDCLHCTDTGPLELDNSKLGAWKVEAECDYGAYGGPKMYACKETDQWYQSRLSSDSKHKKWKTASKGVKLTYSEIIRVAQGETIRYVPDVPQFSIKRGVHFVPRKISRTT